jgi:hypothetical protein
MSNTEPTNFMAKKPGPNASPEEFARWRDAGSAHSRLNMYLDTGGPGMRGIYPGGVTPSAQEYQIFRNAGHDLGAIR